MDEREDAEMIELQLEVERVERERDALRAVGDQMAQMVEERWGNPEVKCDCDVCVSARAWRALTSPDGISPALMEVLAGPRGLEHFLGDTPPSAFAPISDAEFFAAMDEVAERMSATREQIDAWHGRHSE